MSDLQVGDKVGYSAAFCHNVQIDYEGAQRRGTVVAIVQGHWARVEWNDGASTLARCGNLAVPGSARFVHSDL